MLMPPVKARRPSIMATFLWSLLSNQPIPRLKDGGLKAVQCTPPRASFLKKAAGVSKQPM